MKIISEHPEYLCKYNKAVSLPAIAFSQCEDCQAYLCPTCGYIRKEKGYEYRLCNECYKKAEEEKRLELIKNG